MPHYRAAADGNQPDIIKALRGAGATVTACHAVGKGFPDLVVGFRGANYLIEVKDPSQPKHRHDLTPQQVKWHGEWQGQVAKVFTANEALRVIGAPVDVPFRGSVS